MDMHLKSSTKKVNVSPKNQDPENHQGTSVVKAQ